MKDNLPVAVIGGGAVGMAAAAHLIKRGLPFILFEAGSSIGANILDWSHVKVFSPWRYNIDKAAEELLLQVGWVSPEKDSIHTGKEFVDSYLTPLQNHPAVNPFVHLRSKVTSVGRKNMDKMKTKGRSEQPFILQVEQQGETRYFEASAIIDASGTWHNGNPIGAGGLFAANEAKHQDRMYYGIPDVAGKLKERYKNKRVAVVGGGHSAINTILELDKLKNEFPCTEIHWILRKKHISDIYGGKENDALPARGALGIRIEALVNEDRLSVYTPFQIQEIREEGGSLTLIGTQYENRKALAGVDEIISNTGTRPDFSFLREVRVDYDSTVESVPALADLIDPNLHSCGTVRPHGERELRQKEPNFYVVGMKSYGRAPTFLMATGYEQVRSITAALAGDWEAAAKVELDLPETGVCNSNIVEEESCCAVVAEDNNQISCCQ